jgi:hypothetical protein
VEHDEGLPSVTPPESNMSRSDIPALVVAYDLRDPATWQAAHRHRATWGRRYTDIVALDYDHVALVFRPAPDQRWRPWEAGRQSRILGELQESEAA